MHILWQHAERLLVRLRVHKTREPTPEITEWQPSWETLQNSQMPEEDTVQAWLQQSVTSTTTISPSRSRTMTPTGLYSITPQDPQSPISLDNGMASRTHRLRRDSLSPLKRQLGFSTITSSCGSSTQSLLGIAPVTMQHSMDPCCSGCSPGQELLDQHKETSIPSIRTSVSCQTVRPTCLEYNTTRMKQTSSKTTQTINDKQKSLLSPSTDRMLSQRELPYQRAITISPPFRSIPTMGGTTPTGEVYSSNAEQPESPQQLTQSMSPSLLSSPSTSVGEGGSLRLVLNAGYLLGSNQLGAHIGGDTMLMLLKQMKHLVSLVGSATHLCTTATSPHRHWLVKMSQQIRLTSFPLLVKQHCWVSPLTPTGEDTLREAIAKYINYIKGKGLGHIEMGPPMIPAQVKSKNRRTKNEILELVLAGERPSKICLRFPQLMSNIYKLARFRPQCTCRTDLVYYYGPPGTGKTTSISRVLNTIRKLYPTVDYYSKMGGLSKFFDGYDNQPICWIDDPVSPSCFRTGDEEPVQRFKTVVSTGEILVEVKHGSMVFDSSLIIVSTNIGPDDMSKACGLDNEQAMYRRFTDTCGAFEIKNRSIARNNMIEHLIKIIAKNVEFNHDVTVDIEHVVRSIPAVKNLEYTDCMQMQNFDCKKYFD